MEKTLYYDIEIRELNKMYNKGFIIIKLDGNRLLGLEGVITFDYIKAKMIEEDKLSIVYYSFDCESQMLLEDFEIIIPKENLEIPLNIGFTMCDIDGTEEMIEITTKNKVTNNEIQKRYKKILERFKKNSVF